MRNAQHLRDMLKVFIILSNSLLRGWEAMMTYMLPDGHWATEVPLGSSWHWLPSSHPQCPVPSGIIAPSITVSAQRQAAGGPVPWGTVGASDRFSSDCLSSHIAQGDLEFPVSCFSPKSSGFTSVPHLVSRVFLISSRLWWSQRLDCWSFPVLKSPLCWTKTLQVLDYLLCHKNEWGLTDATEPGNHCAEWKKRRERTT